jgi:hypothetical protein
MLPRSRRRRPPTTAGRGCLQVDRSVAGKVAPAVRGVRPPRCGSGASLVSVPGLPTPAVGPMSSLDREHLRSTWTKVPSGARVAVGNRPIPFPGATQGGAPQVVPSPGTHDCRRRTLGDPTVRTSRGRRAGRRLVVALATASLALGLTPLAFADLSNGLPTTDDPRFDLAGGYATRRPPASASTSSVASTRGHAVLQPGCDRLHRLRELRPRLQRRPPDPGQLARVPDLRHQRPVGTRRCAPRCCVRAGRVT